MGEGGLDLESEPGHIHPFLLPVPSLAKCFLEGSLAQKTTASSQTPELTGRAGWHLREEGET